MESSHIKPIKKWLAIKRGVRLQCPKCGKAPLFHRYLKPVKACQSCGKNWEMVRADDGPAWLTIVIVGHLLAPFFHFLIFKSGLPDWGIIGLLSAVAIALCLILLPRSKGAFMAIIWASGAPTS